MTTTSAPAPATPSRPRRILGITVAIVAALVVAFFVFASLYADWLWYRQLEFEGVLLTQWVARIAMFAIGFLGMAVPVWLAIQLAYRLRPVYARLSSQLDRYQEVVEPLRRLAMWGIPVFFGFFAGFAASAQWQTTWLWFNGVPTGDVDPEFGLDTGFYLFALPFYGAVVGFVSAVLLICLLVTAVVSYLYGSVRVGQRELRISKAARIQLAILAGLYLAVQAVSLFGVRLGPVLVQVVAVPGLRRGDHVRPGQGVELAPLRHVPDVHPVRPGRLGHFDVPVVAPAVDVHVPDDPDVSVAASNWLAPHLAHRETLYLFPTRDGDGGPADYIVVDLYRASYFTGVDRLRGQRALEGIIDDPAYQTVYTSPNVSVFERIGRNEP